jgi:hypothetical protein
LTSPAPASTAYSVQPENSAAAPSSPSCQLAWPAVSPGSSVSLSAWNLAPNQAAHASLGNQGAVTSGRAVTDNTGFLKLNLEIPSDQPQGVYRVSISTEESYLSARCQLWIWPSATPPKISTGLAENLASTLACNPGVIRFSSDGEWAVLDCSVYEVTLIRLDETREWSLSSTSLIGPFTTHFVNVFGWSVDGKYAYVGANPHTDGFWEPFHQVSDLFQLDLQTGEIISLLKGAYYSFSFSPDGKLLAYVETAQSPVILHIRNLEWGTEQSAQFDSKYNTAGSYIWSPDSRDLIFSMVQYDIGNFEYVTSAVAFWDGKLGKVTRLLEGYSEILVPVRWIDQTHAIVQVKDEGEREFELDLITGELVRSKP